MRSFITSIFRMMKWRGMRWAGHVERIGAKKNEYGILVGKPERKRPLVRSSHRRVDNIKMDLLEIDCGGIFFALMSGIPISVYDV
jgi:hypothetical protein